MSGFAPPREQQDIQQNGVVEQYTISKSFRFCASHKLEGLAPGHKCANVHGHNYEVEVVLRGSLNSQGFVRDYRDLSSLGQYLDSRYDHKHLNDLMAENPTAENIARCLFQWCFDQWPEVVAVRVSETPSTWAEFRLEEE